MGEGWVGVMPMKRIVFQETSPHPKPLPIKGEGL